jgi:hypothetical protein
MNVRQPPQWAPAGHESPSATIVSPAFGSLVATFVVDPSVD